MQNPLEHQYPSTSAVLSLRDVGFAYRHRTILDNLNLEIGPGQSMAITGRSGSGKSTLLSLVTGLLRPKYGTILLLDYTLERLGARALARVRRRHLGIVFQAGELMPAMTAIENVALPLLLDGGSWDSAAKAARELLMQLEVDERSHNLPAALLSGGERQRTAVARAMITKPELVVADEPTGALDEDTRNDVADILFGLPQRTGCSLLVVTHDPAIAARANTHLFLTEGALTANAVRV